MNETKSRYMWNPYKSANANGRIIKPHEYTLSFNPAKTALPLVIEVIYSASARQTNLPSFQTPSTAAQTLIPPCKN